MQELLQEYGVAVLFPAMIAVLAVAALWEYLAPRRHETLQTNRRWANNIGLTAINQVNVDWFTALVTSAIALWGNEAEIGLFRHFDIGFWPTLLVVILSFEFINYWFHRALHTVPWLWRIHVVHHNDTELDFTTTYRSHPLELYIIAPLTVPLVLGLGFSAESVIAYQLLRITIVIIAHSNIRLPEKVDTVLRRVIVTPDFHRVHHSSHQPLTDSNFSATFPFYDYLFGTAKRIPYRDHETMEIGLRYLRDPRDSRIDRLLLIPFTRRRLSTSGNDAASVAQPESA